MDAAGVPTARLLETPVAPCVVKADGLAAGKGVVVCRTQAELQAGLDVVRALGDDLIVEELLEGPEVSVLAVCDGVTAVPLPPAQDFKRAFDDDGARHGWHGALCARARCWRRRHRRDHRARSPARAPSSSRAGAPFIGTLFAGLIVTADGREYWSSTARFGDPETQSLLPCSRATCFRRWQRQPPATLRATRSRPATRLPSAWVLAAADYPAGSDRGTEIEGVDTAEALGALVFHAGTALRDGRLVTNGGRILRRHSDGCGSGRSPRARVTRLPTASRGPVRDIKDIAPLRSGRRGGHPAFVAAAPVSPSSGFVPVAPGFGSTGGPPGFGFGFFFGGPTSTNEFSAL